MSSSGQGTTVPNYRHVVELDFVRYELAVTYKMAERWDAWFRVPYDVKIRKADVVVVDPATAQEIVEMQGHLDIHHPTATLEGFSDFSLLAARKDQDVLREGDTLAAALGVSLPVGKTEGNPFTAGDLQLAHEHIQFGSGTFNPLLEFYYLTPVSKRVSLSTNMVGKIPLYQNSKGYRAPLEVSAGLRFALALTNRMDLRAGWSYYYQGYARWDGNRDVNSGLVSNGAVGGASYKFSDRLQLSLDARFPISQSTLSEEGDTFEQGTVVQLGLSYSF